MPQLCELHCSDDLFKSLVGAAHCSFILLAMRRLDQPRDSFEIAELLCLELLHCEDQLDTLIKFGFILPAEDGDKFTITPAGSDLISPKPLQPPWASIIILFFSGLLSFGFANFLFSWDSQNTTRRGHPLLALFAWLPDVLSVAIGIILVLY
jgi:hypothetical protein